jgi:dynactin 6
METSDVASKAAPTAASGATRMKRTSTAAPKPPTSLDPNALIANHAVLTGIHAISVGPQTVVHPHAKLVSTYSEVEIGAGCLILERAIVGLSDNSEDAPPGNAPLPERIVVEDNVTIESGSIVEAARIGANSFIDVGVIIGAGAVIGKVQSRASRGQARHLRALLTSQDRFD